MGDAYIRLRRTGPRLFGPPDGPDSLLFVDVDEGADFAALREVPHAFVSSARYLLARSKNQSDEQELTELVHRLGISATAGLLRQELGLAPAATWKKTVNNDVLIRARRVELRALLKWGGAIWEARNHHFVLPSGIHANAFVKLGYAIGEPRDAEVCASWLLDRFDSQTPTSIILDTGTLSSIALALKVHASAAIGAIAILEQYPSTNVDVERAIDSVSMTNRVAAFISVCSSGSLRDRLRNVFAYKEPTGLKWTIDAVVDLKGGQPDSGRIRSWVVLPRDDGAVVVESFASECKLCHTHERSTVIPIEPITFDAYIPAMREHEMPDVMDADRNRDFWEACSRSASLLIEARPDEHVRTWRRTGEVMPVKIDFDKLLDLAFIERASQKFREIAAEDQAVSECDLVLIFAPDEARLGYDGLFSSLFAITCRIPDRQVIPAGIGEWSTEIRVAVQAASHIVVFALGTVTGAGLQRALIGVQTVRRDSRRGVDYTLAGVVVHARPERKRDWETLSNSGLPPKKRTPELRHFSHTQACVISALEVEGRQIVETRVPTLSIVEDLDPFGNGRLCRMA